MRSTEAIDAAIRTSRGVVARHEAWVRRLARADADTAAAEAMLRVFRGTLECQRLTRTLIEQVTENTEANDRGVVEHEAVAAGATRGTDDDWLELQSQRDTARDVEDAAHGRLLEAITGGTSNLIAQAAAAASRAEATAASVRGQVLAHLDRRTRAVSQRFDRAVAEWSEPLD